MIPVHDQINNIRLRTRELSVSNADKELLKKVSIDFPKNSVTALIGPSGSGKSTFLKCINRMHDHKKDFKISGLVELDGEDVYAPKADVLALRSKVGMVFQKPNPFIKSIWLNVAYGPKIRGVKDKKELNDIVSKSLKRAGLYDEVIDRINDSALSLSGGQQQRLCIARALATNPELILMDEPCSALDPMSTMTIDNLVLELKQDYTIIVVTHSMRQAQKIADFVAFFSGGELAEYGSVSKIFSAPDSVQTAEYVNSGLK